MRTGPITQFWTRESPSTFLFLKTSPISSYFTLAKGGYIMRISPMAMGILVVPTWNGIDERLRARDEVAGADADGHGGEDPEGQVAVEERQFFCDTSGHYAMPPALQPVIIPMEENLRSSTPLSMESVNV